MACRKLKPIEERDPQAARILEVFDRLHGLDQPAETKAATRPALQLVGGRKPTPKSSQGGWGAPDFTGAITGLVIAGIVIGAAASVGVPWLWGMLKPWLHAVTA